ncbi:MAG: prepilin-type N-terminal cleavage/methylation domain-containing protein [bacterium]|nr:prepilin-type N-terminal cleavage/methylation domain-containing protein [bacterium]
MKKNGFTLSEILIALGIVSVISVLMIALVSTARPDKYRPVVLKYYANVAKVTNDLLSNSSIYFNKGVLQNGIDTCVGLNCTHKPKIAPFTSDSQFEGDHKYENIMRVMLNLDEDFKYIDGSVWSFRNLVAQPSYPPIHGNEGYRLVIDMNGDEEPNCFYSTDCRRPDQYRFWIRETGEVLPDDALSAAYISNPRANRDADREYAETHINDFIGPSDTPAND